MTSPLRDALLSWFDAAKRDLPWRRTRDPYAIWVSEVMLQQTRVETVIPYWTRFLRDFPDARALAEAPLDAVLARWAGLGYYRRARMLHAGAQAVVARHGGAVPADWDQLRALPGVGDYTAGAIGSIAFGLPVPVVDGNVERVLTRLHAMPGDPREAKTRRRVWSLARALAEGPRPGDLNQALMELGATVCAPASPRCLVCPLRAWCAAAAEGAPERYPEKSPKKDVPREPWTALVATREGALWLVPSATGRWQGMLVPPMARGHEGDVDARAAALSPDVPLSNARDAGSVTHVLTHARMELRVITATLSSPPPRGELVAPAALDAKAVPKVTFRVLARAGFAG